MNPVYRIFRNGGLFIARVFGRYWRHDGDVTAGNIAYASMLALVPFLIFATALTGFVVGPQGTDQTLAMLFRALPDHVARTLEPVVVEVVGRRRCDILTIAALGAIWAASNGVEAVRVGLDRAYESDLHRHFTISRVLAIGIVLAGFAIFILIAILIIIAPLAFALFEQATGIPVPLTADLLRYAIATGLLAIFLWYIHRLLPSRRMRHFRLWPGIAATVLILVVAGTLFSAYLAFAPNYAITYGTLGGVVVTLLFFYMTGVALIMGAEVNAVVNARRLAAEPVHPDEPETGLGDETRV